MKTHRILSIGMFVAWTFLLSGCESDSAEKPQTPNLPEKLTFELKASSADRSVNVTVEPSSAEIPYYIAFFTEEQYSGIGSGDERAANWVAREIARGNISEADLLKGKGRKTYDALTLDAEYYVAVVGVYNNRAHGFEVKTVTTRRWENDGFAQHIMPTLNAIDVDWAEIDLQVEDQSQYYLVFSESNYNLPFIAPEEYAEAYIENWLETTRKKNGDISMAELLAQLEKSGKNVYKGDRSIVLKGLAKDWEYGAYVYVIAADGTRQSKLHVVKFKTINMSYKQYGFDVNTSVASRKVTIDVKVPDQAAEWFCFTIEADRWRQMTATESDEYMFDYYLRNLYIGKANSNPGMSHDQVIESLTHVGDAKITVDEKYAETDYVVAVGTVYRGKTGVYLSSATSMGEYKTGKVNQVDANFTIDLANITPFGAEVQVTPSDKEAKYTYAYIPYKGWENFSDEEILAAYIAKKKGSLNAGTGIVKGDKTAKISVLPDTEYVVIAFGYENGGPTTVLSKVLFNSGGSGNAEALAFDLNIAAANYTDVTYDVVPSANDVYWYAGIIEGTEATPAHAEAIRADVESKIAKSYEAGQKNSSNFNFTMVQAVSQVCLVSSKTGIKATKLPSDGTFMVFAVPVTTQGKCVGTPQYKSFSTKKLYGGPAVIDAKIEKYFYPASGAGFIPGINTSFSTYAVYAIELTSVAAEAKELYYATYTMDIKDKTDQEIFETSPPRGTIKSFDSAKSVCYFAGQINRPMWVILAAKDANGVYGNLKRIELLPKEASALSISDLRAFYEQHNGPIN